MLVNTFWYIFDLYRVVSHCYSLFFYFKFNKILPFSDDYQRQDEGNYADNIESDNNNRYNIFRDSRISLKDRDLLNLAGDNKHWVGNAFKVFYISIKRAANIIHIVSTTKRFDALFSSLFNRLIASIFISRII